MAMARVSCASLLMEPNDMAEVTKRFTIVSTGSTSSSGTGVALREAEKAAQRAQACVLSSLIDAAYCRYSSSSFSRTARCRSAMAWGESRWPSEKLRKWMAPPESRASRSSGVREYAAVCRARTSRAMASMPMPPMREGVPGKYFWTKSSARPTASKICALL